jgi:predicted DNA-binding antitoxin AbrB/MazE fold protein
MGQQIIEAILENGQIKSVSKKLPGGKLKVHLIYDKKDISSTNLADIIAETSGIYKNIDVDDESRKLRAGWERNNVI